MPVTLRDIAGRLGISVATVSRALSGYPDILGSTPARVLQAADDMRYRPNISVRRLRQQLTTIRGFVVPTHGPRLSPLIQRALHWHQQRGRRARTTVPGLCGGARGRARQLRADGNKAVCGWHARCAHWPPGSTYRRVARVGFFFCQLRRLPRRRLLPLARRRREEETAPDHAAPHRSGTSTHPVHQRINGPHVRLASTGGLHDGPSDWRDPIRRVPAD